MVDPLWAEFINSDWHDYRGSGAHEDRIGNDQWLSEFLSRAGWVADEMPTARERDELRSLRSMMLRAADEFRATGSVPERELESLNRALAGEPMVRQLVLQGEGKLTLAIVPVRDGIARVIGEVVSSFASMLAEGEPERLKICANPDCRWVIYDQSRNRSRRWCDAADCGNLIKVRRHRRRKRASRRD